MEEGDQDKSKKRQPKTIIIGAGISGLSAGKYLSSEGYNDFLILEASDRIGGRIWTIPVDENGHKAEMGANWIHGVKNNPIYKIADENNLLLERELNLNSKNLYKTEEGYTIPDGLAKKVDFNYGTMLSSCEEYFLSRIPTDESDSVGAELDRLIDYKLQNIIGEERIELEFMYHQRKLLECCISGCDSLNDLSLSQFGSYKELPGRHLVIPRGFNAILDIVREGIPDEKIKLNSCVRNIYWDNTVDVHRDNQCPEDMIHVECENGDVFYADHVIVTVSLGVLKAACDKMFTPVLPQKKRDAIHDLGFGVVNKVILVFDAPIPLDANAARVHLVWDPSIITTENLRKRWFRKIYSFEVEHDNVLVGWLSGTEAIFLESLTEEEIKEDMERVVRTFFKGQNIPNIVKVVRTSWAHNKLTRGSYSFISVGSTQKQMFQLAHPLTMNLQDNTKKPVVLFAGEATNPMYYSTAHGALLTGHREAARICKFWDTSGSGELAKYQSLGLSDEENESNDSEEKESSDESEEEGLSF